MKKILIAFAAATLIPMTAAACTYENIKLENGTVKGRYVPCQNESCEDYQRHMDMIENQNVHVNDAAPAKPVDRTSSANIKVEEDAGKVYDKKQQRERNVDAVNTENEIIGKYTGKLPEQKR